VILQVMGRDGMSTPQNGAAAYSFTYHIFPSAFPAVFVSSVSCYSRSS